MSELTRCNYCSLNSYRYMAKKENKRITLLPEEGGIAVYIHPKNMNIRRLSKEEKAPYYRGWFMELTDHCVC